MSSPTLTETEYLPLHSSRFDNTLRLKPDILIHTSRKVPRKSSPTKLRHTLLTRTGAFVIIELGFIILTFLATINPIPLHISSSATRLTEAKGAPTIISVTWHALAVFAIKDVILHIFSAEWMEQYHKSGSIILGETDGVSRITSGIVDQIQHFISPKATSPFRLGFVSALLLLLNGLGPSAITINSISLEYPLKIKVANLTVTLSLQDWPQYSVLTDRANLITRLEQLENATYGFRAQQPNVLIPWPSSDLISRNGTIKYQSDVITYNFSCLWKEPAAAKDVPLRWMIDDQEWGASIPRGIDVYLDTGSSLMTATPVILPMRHVHGLLGAANSSLVAFLVIGKNTTLSKDFHIDLDGIPAHLMFPDSKVTQERPDAGPILVTVLICDPHLNISPATVFFSGGSLRADTRSGPPVVKNIPTKAANTIFSQSLVQAASVPELYPRYPASTINSIASILFLTDPSLSHDDEPKGIKPLSLDRINQHMNTIYLSSAKAFLSGSRPDEDNPTSLVFKMMDTDALAERQELALIGSKQFLIALVAAVGVLTALLVTIVAVVRVNQLQTFDLENIIQILKIQ